MMSLQALLWCLIEQRKKLRESHNPKQGRISSKGSHQKSVGNSCCISFIRKSFMGVKYYCLQVHILEFSFVYFFFQNTLCAVDVFCMKRNVNKSISHLGTMCMKSVGPATIQQQVSRVLAPNLPATHLQLQHTVKTFFSPGCCSKNEHKIYAHAPSYLSSTCNHCQIAGFGTPSFPAGRLWSVL